MGCSRTATPPTNPNPFITLVNTVSWQVIRYNNVCPLVPKSNKYLLYQIFGQFFVAHPPKSSMVEGLPILVKAFCEGISIPFTYFIPQ